MKRDWLVVTVLLFVLALFSAAAGGDWMRGALHIVRGWLLELPGPTEHFASLIGSFAWPIAVLLIVWWLRRPIYFALRTLAARFETDDVDLGGWVKVTAKGVSTYSPEAVAQQQDAPEKVDVNHAEAILEYAATPEAADKVINWIYERLGTGCDIEAFFNDPMFAEERAELYKELIEGPK